MRWAQWRNVTLCWLVVLAHNMADWPTAFAHRTYSYSCSCTLHGRPFQWDCTDTYRSRCGKWTMAKTKISCIREFITHFLLVRLMGNPMSFLWARARAATIHRIIHSIYYHRRTHYARIRARVWGRVVAYVCECVRIGRLIDALNFSVIVHKSRKYTVVHHTRALFGVTSIRNRVFGAYLEQKYARGTHISVAVTHTQHAHTQWMTHDGGARTHTHTQRHNSIERIHVRMHWRWNSARADCSSALDRLLSIHFYYLLLTNIWIFMWFCGSAPHIPFWN